jgi:hypothetical protein
LGLIVEVGFAGSDPVVTLFSLAGFQVIIGRFWVTPEGTTARKLSGPSVGRQRFNSDEMRRRRLLAMQFLAHIHHKRYALTSKTQGAEFSSREEGRK